MSEEAQIRKALAISGIKGPERNVLTGNYQSFYTTAQNLGQVPTKEVVYSPSLGRGYTRGISPARGAKSVNALITDAENYTGKRFKQALSDPTFRKLGEFPGRMSLNAYESDNSTDKIHALRHYLHMAVPYVNQHAGGIIGDNIKEEYFQGGRLRWKPLQMETIKAKIEKYGKYKGSVPTPHIPLHGITFTATLPWGWQSYTYRWGGWPRGGRFGLKSAPGLASGKGIGLKYTSTYTMSPQKQFKKQTGQFAAEPTKVKGVGTVYPPSMRGKALMDIVAKLNVQTVVTKPYAGRGYEAAVKASSRNPDPQGIGSMQAYGIVQPFYIAPYVWAHEYGRGNNPKRSFIIPGTAQGMGEVEHLFRIYLEEGKKAMIKALHETEHRCLKDLDAINNFYKMESEEMADMLSEANIRGAKGTKGEPQNALYDLMFDNVYYKKHKQMKSLIRKLFGNHLIWWFLPPSKYYHYIGMAFDIYGLKSGIKNVGAVTAYVKALTIGLAGARAGSPIAFTKKARRRQFRKTLYSRAGYHRTRVGGHH